MDIKQFQVVSVTEKLGTTKRGGVMVRGPPGDGGRGEGRLGEKGAPAA